ncbi:MAG: hypothetical protein AABM66_08635 [Actinomycetota bacterium]
MTADEARLAGRRDAERAVALAREEPDETEAAAPEEPPTDLFVDLDPGRPGSAARRLVSGWRAAGHIAARVSEEAQRAAEAGGEVWAAYGAALDAGLSDANVTLIPTWYSDERDRIVRGLYVVDRNRFPEAAAGMRTMTEKGIEYTWEGDVQRAFRAPPRGFLKRLKSRRGGANDG